jgi:hypothetical protein
MQLALPRPISAADGSLPFTKSLATALEPAAARLDVSPALQVMGDTLHCPQALGLLQRGADV